MSLQDTDNFVVQRGPQNYRMAATDLEFASSPIVITSPLTPVDFESGTLWLNTDTNDLSVWDGTAWQSTIDSTKIIWKSADGVPRTVDSKVRDRISVKDFGAIGDGVVDDTAAIQSAINTLGPWKKLYFPTGKYVISSELTLPDDGSGNAGFVCAGDGKDTQLITSGTNGIFNVGSLKYTTFENLTFVKTANFGVGTAILLSVPEVTNDGTLGGYLKVNFCTFVNWGTGVYFTSPNIQIVNSDFKNCVCAIDSYGFGNSIFIKSNIITSSTGTCVGIRLRHNAQTTNSYSHRAFITNNSLLFSSPTINASPIIVNGGSDFYIFNNFIYNYGSCSLDNITVNPAGGLNGAISARISGTFSAPYLHNLQIVNNTIYSAKILAGGNYGGIGINVLGGTLPVYGVNILNNNFYTVDGSGRAIHMDKVNEYSISGNNISGTNVGDDYGRGYAISQLSLTNQLNGNSFCNYDRYTSGTLFEINSLTNPLVIKNNIRAFVGSSAVEGDFNEFSTNNTDNASLILGSTGAAYTNDSILHLQIENDIGTSSNMFLMGADDKNINYYVAGDGSVYNLNGVYGAVSDARLKKDIQDAPSQWNDITKLRLCNFNWKKDNTRQFGLIAQEVEDVSPEMVTEDNELKSVNYSLLFMKSLGALKEAMKTVEELEFKVKQLRR
jgi:hypothetical protein